MLNMEAYVVYMYHVHTVHIVSLSAPFVPSPPKLMKCDGEYKELFLCNHVHVCCMWLVILVLHS